ncbi:hypothetical protein VHUM_04345 [Vanrija humicola]|uniref:RGS domain-containing protein n=1 Tax=Vanrija humicola TaxID=5417 RepID=A0A7D8Z524_VANHU|nr:hypothetical protein VHUM_04345 [Vanrija humicola]
MSTHSSHLMKTTRRGRPFVKDTHDLFATLVVSLNLDNHRSFFRTYPNSFTTDEACSNLSSLKFSQSNRSADPKDPSRIITTTTTTTFSMSRDMARGVGQLFIDAQLVENATDIPSKIFKERGVFMLTAKGLHILERFITKNGIAADHLLRVFATQPICMKLLHLERRTQDDEILITRSVMEVLFRRFIGREPNVSKLNDDELLGQFHSRPHNKAPALPPGEECDRTLGMVLRRVWLPPAEGKKTQTEEYQFSASSAIDWLIDFTTIVGLDEAAEVAGQFVRYGYISLVSDKGKVKEGNLVVTVRAGGAGGGAGAQMTEAEFRATDRAIYRVTELGATVAKWGAEEPAPTKPATGAFTRKPNKADPFDDEAEAPARSLAQPAVDNSLTRRSSVSDRLRTEYADEGSKDSHTARLKQILEEPALRSLFREFLRANFCEENLSFWLDVQDFKRRFNTSSSAAAAPGALPTQRGQGLQAMEKHQQDLIAMAFVIYNTYLAPASPCELNIDHQLRGELISYMNEILEDKDAGAKAQILPGVGNSLHASQLQNMVRLYERIQQYIFRLMATDSVPKFCKTERFLTLMRSVFDYTAAVDEQPEDPATSALAAKTTVLSIGPTPTKVDDVGRAYLTISQAANEKQQAGLSKS